MLNLILGPAGSGKTEYVFSRIKEGEVILLVPEQSSFENERKASHLGNVKVLSFTRLVHMFEEQFGGSYKEEADSPVKSIIMRRAVKSVASMLQCFGNVYNDNAFITNMLHLITELKQSEILPEDLLSLTNIGGTVSKKAKDVAFVYSAYESLLADKFKDPLQSLSELSSRLDEHKYFEGKKVYIDSFEFFTQQQFEIISKMISQCNEVYITLCTDNIKGDKFGAFVNVNKIINRLNMIAKEQGVKISSPVILSKPLRFKNDQLKSVESILRTGEGIECQGDNVTICSCPTVYEECDYVARTIRHLVRTQGYRYRDFAVIARDMSLYSTALCDTLDKYGVYYFSDSRVKTDSLVLIRFVINALLCSVNNFRNEYLLSLIKSPLSPITDKEAGELDNFAFIWNKKGSDWLYEFTENPDGDDAKFNQEKLDYINSLRKKVIEHLLILSKELDVKDTKSRCKAIYNFIKNSSVSSRLKQYCHRLKQNNDNLLYDITVKSWDLLMSSFDTVIKALGEEQMPLDDFVDIFINHLSSLDIGHVPSRIDEVVLGSADRIRVSSPKVTFIMGANFGEFPKTVSSAGLLTTSDRRKLIKGGLDIFDYSQSGVIDEKFFLYTSLCTPSEKLFITYHTSDLKSKSCNKSEFVSALEKKLCGVIKTTVSLSDINRFEGAQPALEQVLSPDYMKYSKSLEEYFEKTENRLAGVITSVTESQKEKSLSKETALNLFGKNIGMSASRAEVYSKCPFSYFCKFGLNIKDLQVAELGARQRGTLIHGVLEDVIKKYGSSLNEVDDVQLRLDIETSADLIVKERFGNSKMTDSFVFLVNRIKSVLFYLLRSIGEEFLQSRFKPDRFEAKIGEEIKGVEIPLEQGKLKIGGSVDRVDVYEKDNQTYVRVIDYKSGTKSFSLAEVMQGLNMQMLIYLFAIIDSGAYENATEGGILYFPAKRSLPSLKKNEDISKAEGERKKSLKMNGLILSDDDVISAMEKDKKGVYIPYSESARGTKSVATKDDFALIKQKVYSLLRDMGDNLHNGKIEINPLDSNDTKACKYCEFKSVCRKEDLDNCQKVKSQPLFDTINSLRGESQNEAD